MCCMHIQVYNLFHYIKFSIRLVNTIFEYYSVDSEGTWVHYVYTLPV